MSGNREGRPIRRRFTPVMWSKARSNWGASALILGRTRSSGDLASSAIDIGLTINTIKTAASLGKAVHDHLIISQREHSSLRNYRIIPNEVKNSKVYLSTPVFARYSVLYGDNPKD
jgi:hypothetical protein